MKCNILTLRQNQWDWELQHNKSNGYCTTGHQKFTVIMFREGTWFCKTHFYFTGISAISHYLTIISQQFAALRKKPKHRGKEESKSPKGKIGILNNEMTEIIKCKLLPDKSYSIVVNILLLCVFKLHLSFITTEH